MAPSHRAIPANERRVTQLDERTLADRERVLGERCSASDACLQGLLADYTAGQGRDGLSHVKEKLNGGQVNEAAPE